MHEALLGAVANLPPSQRYDAIVPPAAVLGAWLEDVAEQGSGLERTATGWSWDLRMPRVDAALVALLPGAQDWSSSPTPPPE